MPSRSERRDAVGLEVDIHERARLPPVALALVCVGASATAVAALWPSAPAGSGSTLAYLGVGLLLCAVVALLFRVRRARIAAVLVVAAALGLWLVPAGLAEVRGGWPGPASPLGALAIIVTAAGALLALAATLRRRAARTRLVAAGPAAAVAIVVVAAGTVAAVRWPVRSTEADAIDRLATPATVSVEAWRWEAPGQVRDLVAAGAGVAVLVQDGLVALDGATGEPRWQYRRRGAVARAIGATTDGSTVAILFDGPDGNRSMAVSLDAMTGGLNATAAVPVHLGWGLSLQTTRSAVLGQSERDQAIVALDALTLQERWRWRLPHGCGGDGALRELDHAAGADVVLTMFYCVEDVETRSPIVRGEAVLLALDERTGAERWRHAVPYEGRPSLDTYVQVSGDRRAVLLHAADTTSPVIDYPTAVYDASTGRQLWRGARDGAVNEAFDSRAIERSRPAPDEGPRVSVRHDFATGASHQGAISQGLCMSGDRPDLTPLGSGVIGDSLLEVCQAEKPLGGRRTWQIEVSSWPMPGPGVVLDVRLRTGPGAATFRPVVVTAAPGAVVVHARADWGPTTTARDGQPATDVVIGLR